MRLISAFIFFEKSKIIEIQNFEPPKMVQADVYVKISASPTLFLQGAAW